VVIGNPEGLEGTVTEGIISAFREGGDIIQITAAISPGSSGSPVLDDDGNVIGVATATYKEGQNLNFAISTNAIQRGIKSLLAKSEGGSSQTAQTPAPTTKSISPEALVIGVNRMLDIHDWQTLTKFTVDGQVNYFGHTRVTNDFIAADMQKDARDYASVQSKVFRETFTHEVSSEYSPPWTVRCSTIQSTSIPKP
jgi:hypothetical protein